MPAAELARAADAVPRARSFVALDPDHFDAIRRAVALLFRVAHEESFQREVDADAGPVARHRAKNFGVFMGYDFHVTRSGPRLIEINTNAGGAKRCATKPPAAKISSSLRREILSPR